MKILSPEQRDFAVELYRDLGYTQSIIAGLVGTTQSNISKLLKKARRADPAVPQRRPGRKGRQGREKMLAVSQLGPARHPVNMDYL